MYSSDEPFQRSREGYFGVYFPSCETTREMSTKITLETGRDESTHIILFLTRYNDDKDHQTIVTRSREQWCLIR